MSSSSFSYTCGGDASQRWKKAANAVEVNISTYLSSECALKEYVIQLNAFAEKGSHFFLSAAADAAAVDQKEVNDCPEALAFASIGGQKITYRIASKNALLNDELNNHVLGTTTLMNIIQAEGHAKAVDDLDYDLTKNSCVHYASDIWRSLELVETAALADFLVENLLKDGKYQTMLLNTLRLINW